MKKNYVEKMIDTFGFLQDYGFALTHDPFNPERLCYQNKYGEIAIWFDKSLVDYDLYVQINGWKTPINLNEEYKKSFGSNPTLCSLKKKFKKLFELSYFNNGHFFGLTIAKEKNIKKEQIKCDLLIDPFQNCKKNNRIVLISIFSIIVMFIQLIVFAFIEDSKRPFFHVWMEYFLVYSTVVIYVISLVTIGKRIDLISRVLAVIYPFILISGLHWLTRREIMKVETIYFGILLLNITFNLFCLFKHKTPIKLTGCMIIIIYPFFSSMIRYVEMGYFVYFNDSIMGNFLLVGVALGIICAICYLIFQKDKSSKKDYFWKLVASFCIPIVIPLFPYFAVQGINYSFDTSAPIECTYKIVDKEKRYNSGRHSSGYRYYFELNKSGDDKMEVHKITYNSYEVGDTIILYKYSGFLGIEYYEYPSETF